MLKDPNMLLSIDLVLTEPICDCAITKPSSSEHKGQKWEMTVGNSNNDSTKLYLTIGCTICKQTRLIVNNAESKVRFVFRSTKDAVENNASTNSNTSKIDFGNDPT